MRPFENLRVMSGLFALLNALGQIVNVLVIEALDMKRYMALAILPVLFGIAACVLFLCIAFFAGNNAQDTSAPRRFWLVLTYAAATPMVTYAMKIVSDDTVLFGSSYEMAAIAASALFVISLPGLLLAWVSQFTGPYILLEQITK